MTMPLGLAVPLLVFTAIVQITLLPHVPILGVKPELALTLVVAWAMLAPVGEAAVWGFLLGLFLDMASGLPFGMHMLVLTMLGWLLGWVQTIFARSNLLVPPVTIFLVTFGYHLALLGFIHLFYTPVDWWAYLLRVTLPTALLNLLVLPLVFFPLRYLVHRWHPQLEFD